MVVVASIKHLTNESFLLHTIFSFSSMIHGKITTYDGYYYAYTMNDSYNSDLNFTETYTYLIKETKSKYK